MMTFCRRQQEMKYLICGLLPVSCIKWVFQDLLHLWLSISHCIKHGQIVTTVTGNLYIAIKLSFLNLSHTGIATMRSV